MSVRVMTGCPSMDDISWELNIRILSGIFRRSSAAVNVARGLVTLGDLDSKIVLMTFMPASVVTATGCVSVDTATAGTSACFFVADLVSS